MLLLYVNIQHNIVLYIPRKTKRGFKSEDEASAWGEEFSSNAAGSVSSTFAAFFEVYKKDMKPRLRESTWIGKEYMVRDKLLPTIKSRCRQMVLPPPSHSQALHYLRERGVAQAEALLAFHSGAPLFEHAPESDELRAELLRLLAAPRLLAILDYAAAFDRQKQPLAVFIGWMQKWLLDVGLAQQKMPPLYYPEYAAQSADTAARTEAAALFALAGRLNALSPYGYHTLSVRMQLEYLLTDYLEFWQNKRVTP